MRRYRIRIYILVFLSKHAIEKSSMCGGSPLGGARQLERLDEAEHGVVAKGEKGRRRDLHRVGQMRRRIGSVQWWNARCRRLGRKAGCRKVVESQGVRRSTQNEIVVGREG